MTLIRTFRRRLGDVARWLGLHPFHAKLEAAKTEALADFDGMLDLLLNQAKVPSEAAKGQLKQDIAALVCNAFKRDGYFVDIGAADGIYSRVRTH